jgi:tetratricopeptide (TPR) repeat protein/Tol biopolymer transport system component
VVIGGDEVITWNAVEGKLPGLNTLGFLSRVSPDGQHVVSTVNEEIYVANFVDYRFGQVFYPTRGVLAYYSRETGEQKLLPGADDPGYVHCNPVWSPDGKYLVFSRSKAREAYPKGRPMATYAGDPNETPMQYDLYRIPFNDGRGGVAEPIEGASMNGMSNTFPKVTPDGKWIVWTQCRNGQLMRPDGKLWIVPFEGGEPRLMTCNTDLMNSWHSFSPNGRWMVFSSKTNTPYTQMFLTHIDEDGSDSPPVLIENSTAANRAVNIPEFVNVAYDEFQGIRVPAVDHQIHFRRGTDLAKEGRYAEAVEEFEAALEGEPQAWRTNDWRIHESLSKSLLRVGETERAFEHTVASLKLNPFNAEMHTNMGVIYTQRGSYDLALEHLNRAVKFSPPGFPGAVYNRATLYLRLGDHRRAVQDYSEAIRIQPAYVEAYLGRSAVLRVHGELAGALRDAERAIELNPRLSTAWYTRALVRQDMGDLAGALDDLEQATRLSPDGAERREIENLRAELAATVGRGA